eukprot:scaffold21734_cov72-Phaeocystis_antarctica.AAC.1
MLAIGRECHAARRRAQPPRREQPVRPQAPELNRAIVASRRVPRLRRVLDEPPQLHPLAARAAARWRRAACRLRGLALRHGVLLRADEQLPHTARPHLAAAQRAAAAAIAAAIAVAVVTTALPAQRGHAHAAASRRQAGSAARIEQLLAAELVEVDPAQHVVRGVPQQHHAIGPARCEARAVVGRRGAARDALQRPLVRAQPPPQPRLVPHVEVAAPRAREHAPVGVDRDARQRLQLAPRAEERLAPSERYTACHRAKAQLPLAAHDDPLLSTAHRRRPAVAARTTVWRLATRRATRTHACTSPCWRAVDGGGGGSGGMGSVAEAREQEGDAEDLTRRRGGLEQQRALDVTPRWLARLGWLARPLPLPQRHRVAGVEPRGEDAAAVRREGHRGDGVLVYAAEARRRRLEVCSVPHECVGGACLAAHGEGLLAGHEEVRGGVRSEAQHVVGVLPEEALPAPPLLLVEAERRGAAARRASRLAEPEQHDHRRRRIDRLAPLGPRHVVEAVVPAVAVHPRQLGPLVGRLAWRLAGVAAGCTATARNLLELLDRAAPCRQHAQPLASVGAAARRRRRHREARRRVRAARRAAAVVVTDLLRVPRAHGALLLRVGVDLVQLALARLVPVAPQQRAAIARH